MRERIIGPEANFVSFPLDLSKRPPGYMPLVSEPVFDPSRHLALEPPEDIYSLTDFGYTDADIADCPSNFAATSVFRILSNEGAACLLDVARQLADYTRSNSRIERCTRGGVYRSAFLRDLCLSPDVTAFMSELSGAPLMPHTMPHQLGHLNYAPEDVGADVDKWHVDTLRYDYVMFVTDPKTTQGGAFQYFRGTKQEMATLKSTDQPVPPERIIAPDMPGPGYAILQQGNMVVHQAKGLTAPGERITMVNGYVLRPDKGLDYTRYDQLLHVDPPDVVSGEFTRHMALQAIGQLDQVVQDGCFDPDPEAYAHRLEAIADMLRGTAETLRRPDNKSFEHFGE